MLFRSVANMSKVRQNLTIALRHHGLSGTRIPQEHTVQCDFRRPQLSKFSLVIERDEVYQILDGLFHGSQTGQFLQFLPSSTLRKRCWWDGSNEIHLLEKEVVWPESFPLILREPVRLTFRNLGEDELHS